MVTLGLGTCPVRLCSVPLFQTHLAGTCGISKIFLGSEREGRLLGSVLIFAWSLTCRNTEHPFVLELQGGTGLSQAQSYPGKGQTPRLFKPGC